MTFASCDDDTTTYSTDTYVSKDAQIYSFSVAQVYNSSIEDSVARATDSLHCIAIGSTVFAIDQNRGLIYNPTPLAYGTELRKMKITFSVNTTYGSGSIVVETPDSTYWWNKSDSIDFSKQPVYMEVKATSDSLSTKRYQINIRSYKLDPDSVPWQQEVSLPLSVQQKTLLNTVSDIFYSFAKNASDISVSYAARSAFAWTMPTTTNLPATADVLSINYLNGTFYTIDKSTGKSYSSSNGINWTEIANGLNISAIYGVLPALQVSEDKLLIAVKESDGSHTLAKTTNLGTVEKGGTLRANFPLSGFTSTTSTTRNISTNMLILAGGTSSSGSELANGWWIMVDESGTINLVESFNTNDYFSGDGLSIFLYNNKQYLFSGTDFYYNQNWEKEWYEAPSSMSVQKTVGEFKEASIIIDSDNYIWMFGGKSSSGIYYDRVLKGRMNIFDPNMTYY